YSGGKWKYSGEKPYTGSSYTANLGDAVDNIRIHPDDALISTYTYIPQVGMSSMIDSKGRAGYYDYDELGRLTTIRDQYKNITKQFCYNYAGQQQACFIIDRGIIYARAEIRNYSYSS